MRDIIGNIDIRAIEELFINIHPIQPGGRLTPEAMKALISYGDGYSTCDWCRKPFRLDKIRRPPIEEFHVKLAEFLGMDQVRVVPGARRGFQAVVSSMIEKGDSVIVSSLAHYTEFLAVEAAKGVVKEVPLNENHVITGENTAKKIEEVKKETGVFPKLIMMDHFDYMLGNEHDVRGVARVAKDYGIPFMYNGAYTIGVMPVNGREIGADFLVGSGHKSFASPAPSGILATTEEWSDRVFRTTQMVGDVTKRKFGIKEVEMMGCTLMGATLIAMMASFSTIKERVKHWDKEVEKINYFVKEFLKIQGNKVMSEVPRKHTLTKVDTRGSFDKIAQTHKRRGFFFSDELKKRKIVGEFVGATKTWKMNTYGLTWNQIRYLAQALQDIARKYNIDVA
ncbi:MAG: O-phospho-L-seryl-tRNA:Cys-tRNA synthase [Candidatus Methylarchaceae archaeon HK01B]|nr:O-phospho-L-seryl-tRNA:Cys-tRNA synthase [Candidatus Methylarchaceae archaeon HK01B]